MLIEVHMIGNRSLSSPGRPRIRRSGGVMRASLPSRRLRRSAVSRGAEGPARAVDPALLATYAVCTHEMTEGAGGVAGCFYTYLCVDWRQLTENLEGSREAATQALRRFLYAVALSAPLGLPEGVLVEVKTEPAVPMSYAGAFADPVPLTGRRGLIGESIARLAEQVREVADGYGVAAERTWFSPFGRYPLTGVEGVESTGSFRILVDAVVEGVVGRRGSGVGRRERL